MEDKDGHLARLITRMDLEPNQVIDDETNSILLYQDFAFTEVEDGRGMGYLTHTPSGKRFFCTKTFWQLWTMLVQFKTPFGTPPATDQ
jgi:hypothetical protein